MTTASGNARLVLIGYALQLGGVAAAAVGLVLSLHHLAAAAALIGGGTAFFVGKKLRAA
jgi:hypothetical protein